MNGECVLVRVEDPIEGPKLYIKQADPRAWITTELLAQVRDNPWAPQVRNYHPWVTLTPPADADRGYRFEGFVMRIEAENQTVVYHLRHYDFARDAYAAEWPD